MTDALPVEPGGRVLRLRYAGDCCVCGTPLTAGTRARWDPASRTICCLACLSSPAMPAESAQAPAGSTTGLKNLTPDWGVAGASAQRQFDRQQSRRRARLRSRWVVVALLGMLGALGGAILAAILNAQTMLFVVLGATLPVLKLLATPQHIEAWRSGADGERAVGARLDKLRPAGVLTLHDRRVPGRRANIDHIAVSSAGIFVIDTKNVAGKVTATRNSLRVAGRRRDGMLTGVQGQIAVVRRALGDQPLPAGVVHGVLCFTRADLPWARHDPDGVPLLSPRALSRTLLRPGPLSPEQVERLATVLAERLPSA